jgi:hypothetical protein
MGNLIQTKIIDIDDKYNDIYTSLDDNMINKIRQNYKIIDVEWLSHTLVNSKMFADEYFKNSLGKKIIINNMLKYYLNHEDKSIYKKTDYLCNEKEKICICNIHAKDFRKIYERNNYKEEDKYISWCKKVKDKF